MRILLVNYRYFISGGPEKYMFNIKQVLEQNGHEVIPFSVHSNRNYETEYSRYFVEPIGNRDAVYFEEVKKTPKAVLQMISRSIYSLDVKRAIQREIRETKPDLVYIIHFVNKLSPSVIVGAKQMGIPVVLRLSDYFMLCPRFDFLRDKSVCEECTKKGLKKCIKYRCVKGSLSASLIRVVSMKIHHFMKIYDKVDMFITPSEFLRNKLVENGFDGNKIQCIPTFTSEDKRENITEVGKYALYFGRIAEEKGTEIVVKAFEKMPDKMLKIMGDDTTDEGKKLIEYVRNRQLDNIEFLGFKKGKELEEIIDGARYTLIPSIWYDNLPNTALESFKHGKPVIASNIGSLPELITDGYNGYLFAPGNVEDLVDKHKEIDNEEKLVQMGENSIRVLNEKFSMSMHYNSLISIFENVRDF